MQNQIDIARILLEVGAVAIDATAPFVYASGIRSPIYCDNRLIISFPRERAAIADALAAHLDGRDDVDVIAGTATAGIPWAAWVAERLEKPMIYVRSQPKGHGRGRAIEGLLRPGQRVAVVEDLISTGGSSLGTVQAVRDAGGEVGQCVAIFTYGLPAAARAFADAGVTLLTLTNVRVLLDVAERDGRIDAPARRVVERWLREQAATDR